MNIEQIFKNNEKLQIINTNYKNIESLNDGCGAEHVHKIKTHPSDYPEFMLNKNASFDGDADRIVF